LSDGAIEGSNMTEACRRKLGIARQKCNLVVRGLGNLHLSSIKSQVKLSLCPVRNSTHQIIIDAYVVSQITGLTPSKRVWKSE